MKKLIIFLVVVVALVGGAAGYLLINLNKLVSGLKPRIEQVASDSLGTRFSISTINISVFPDVKLSLRGIALQREGEGSIGLGEAKSEELTIEQINLFIDLKGLLYGNLVVEELSVVTPSVTLIKDVSGVRIAGLGLQPGAGKRDKGLTEPMTSQLGADSNLPVQASGNLLHKEEYPTSGRGSELPFSLALQGLRVEGGIARFIDRTRESKSPKMIEIKDFNLKTAAGLSEGILTLNGLDTSFNIFANQPISLAIDEIDLNLNSQRLKTTKPLRLSIADEALEVAADLGLNDLKGQASLTSGGIKLENLAGVLSGMAEWLGNEQISSLNLRGDVKPQFRLQLNGVDREPSFSGDLGVSDLGLTLSAADGVGGHTIQDLKGSLHVSGTPKAVAVTASGFNLIALSSSFRGGLPLKVALSNLDADFNLMPLAVSLRLPELLVDADGQQLRLGANLRLRDQILNVSDLNLSGFSGGLRGEMELDLKASSFTNRTRAQDIRLSEVMRFVFGDSAQITGELRTLTSNVSGRLGSDLIQTLQGGTEVSLKNLSLKGFNLLREVLAELKTLPFVSGALLNKVPPELQAGINSDSTPFDEVNLRATLQGGSAYVRSLEAKSLLFNLSGQGEIKLVNNRLNLQTDFAIKPPMSIGLAEKVKELRPLLDDRQLLVFPLRIEGSPPKLLVYPDPSKMLEKVGRKLIEQKGQKILKGLLGF